MNMMKAADRAPLRSRRQAECDAVRYHRWATKDPQMVLRICLRDIQYLDGVDARIVAGDPDLSGWEPADSKEGK